ncbi:hypothetical protein GCM10007879_14250 [Maritalea porphyrae]|uniref:Transcriptional regulator n=2 Tax=Maritalea porphyrae TaxID=880732 RepID=A0ABQ5UQ23_9HYPH|nr:hypothetical protein GCM10007879_14250 [Maritalea porphyrae]
MDDLSDNAKAQMINIQATDDQILHLRHRLDLLHQMRDEVARELYQLLKIDGLLD